jgi:transcriptional regulator with PAS, ATPase and Fis domain
MRTRTGAQLTSHLRIAATGGAIDPDSHHFPDLDGRSAEIQRLKRDMARVAADPDVTVLVLGESGTGKERVARAVHRTSPRHAAPFTVVNCAGLSPTLIEDELFGAFTGASDDRPGPFEKAAGGTVFLDEVGDLAADLQMKLLRVLQERTVQRLGGRSETAFDVRVIAATNVDLARATARGRFREDLYYRLKVYELTVPSLRRRGAADISDLADAILRRLSVRRRRWPIGFDPAVLAKLIAHMWPGNVRELENTIERMLVASGDSKILTTEHLPDGFSTMQHVRGGPREGRDGGEGVSMLDVRASLDRNHGNRTKAATELGLSRHQLYRLIKRAGWRADSTTGQPTEMSPWPFGVELGRK